MTKYFYQFLKQVQHNGEAHTKRHITIQGGWFLATLIAIFFISLGAIVFQLAVLFANAIMTHPESIYSYLLITLFVLIVSVILIYIVARHNNRRDDG